MGAIGVSRFGMKDTVKELRLFFETRWAGETYILDCVKVAGEDEGVLYMACTSSHIPGVFAVVVSYFFTESDFVYRVETELVGPVYHECPERIFKKLSPLPISNDLCYKYATEWRKKCVRHIQANRKPRTKRYSNIIGYDFGGKVYNGTRKTRMGRVYEFLIRDENNATGCIATNYKGFRQIIDQYDWPRQ